MKLSYVKNCGLLLTCGVIALSMSVASSLAQDGATCPFQDDEAIIYASPSTFAQLPSLQSVWGTNEAQEALNAAFEKIDKAADEAIEKDDSQKDRFNYLSSFLRDAANEKSFSAATLKCYFTYVDGVVLALDVPDEIKSPEELANGLSLTYILNANPSGLDLKKLFKEGDEFEIVKQNDKELVGKLYVKDKGELKATVYFGGTKVKDLDKYVVVFASREGVEKKLARFQDTNAFIAKRLDGSLYLDYIFKSALFEKAAKELEKKDDSNAKTAAGWIKKVKSFGIQAKGTEDGVCFTTTLEAVDSSSAQDFADIANGGLAVARMKVKEKTDLPKEAEVGVEILKQIVVSHEADSVGVVGSVPVKSEQIATIAGHIWSQIKKSID